MSYLLQYAPRPLERRRGKARVDERLRLNRPEFDGGAEVRVFVQDTTNVRLNGTPPSPRLKLRISDCTDEIALEFDVTSAATRDNAPFKIEKLLGALSRFRDGLLVEAELYALRERQ